MQNQPGTALQVQGQIGDRPPESWSSFGSCELRMTGRGLEITQSSTRSDVEAALSSARRWTLGASPKLISEWLSELWLITAKREGDDQDFRARIAALAKRLDQFPADLVKRALLVERYKFFPTYEEIAIDWRAVRERFSVIKALDDGLRGLPPAKKRVTPEQIAAIRAKYGALTDKGNVCSNGTHMASHGATPDDQEAENDCC